MICLEEELCIFLLLLSAIKQAEQRRQALISGGSRISDQIRGGPGQVHSLNSKNIYTNFSKYFYKNNAEIKTQYNCSVLLKFQNCTVQISHKSYAGSSLRGFISSIRLGLTTS